MLPFVLGGVAIAATGYRIKKILTNESNLDNINDALIKGIDWLEFFLFYSQYHNQQQNLY